jgi:hypothetical protein
MAMPQPIMILTDNCNDIVNKHLTFNTIRQHCKLITRWGLVNAFGSPSAMMSFVSITKNTRIKEQDRQEINLCDVENDAKCNCL